MNYGFENYNKTEILRGHLKLGKVSDGRNTLTVNSRYFEKNGIPFIGVMGEIHFSRIRRSEWRDRLEKMKAGGVNIVSTYLFWIYHEEIEGEYDFSGDNDIRAFILEAQSLGLDVVIRIGPWAHGECRHGGFPDWLLAKGIRLRCNEPEYLTYATDWYRHIYEEVKGLFFKDGGNIIGIQFENELVNAPEHLQKLKEIALSIGFDAPLYTATGWNSKFGARVPVDEFIPVFGAYADAPWSAGIDRRPPSAHFCFDNRRNDRLVGNDVIGESITDADGWRLPYERYPFALCELGPGIQSTYPRRTVISDLDAYSVALVKLGCGNNLIGYYMYTGGSNKIGRLSTLQETRATGSPNDYPVINYDFHTAITEYGEVNPRYGMLNLLHLFVSDFGSILAPMENVYADKPALDPGDFEKLRYALRTDGTGGFIFVNNHQRYGLMKEHRNVSFRALGVTTPEITVESDASFFMPVNMSLSGLKLEYALAQPLCRIGNLYFFIQIKGVPARFKFEGKDEITVPAFDEGDVEKQSEKTDWIGASQNIVSINDKIRICVLPFEKAIYLRRLSNRMVLGNGCNIYEHNEKSLNAEEGATNSLKTVEHGDFTFFEFTDDGEKTTISYKMQKQSKPCCGLTDSADDMKNVTVVQLREMLDYPEKIKDEIIEELHASADEMLVAKPLKFAEDGFATVTDKFDVALVISEGRLVADKFYDRLPFRISEKCTLGTNNLLVMSAPKENIFIDEID